MTPTPLPGRPRNRHRTTILTALSGYAVAVAGLIWLVDGLPTAVRLPLVLPLLVFVPGYAIVTALFPDRAATGSHASGPERGGNANDPIPGGRADAGFSAGERLLLAVVVSIVVVPGLSLAYMAVAHAAPGPVIALVAALTVVASGVAILRAPVVDPIDPAYAGGTAGAGLAARLEPLATDRVTQVAVVLAAVLLVSSAAVAFTGGEESLRTEFYVVSDTGTPGAALADGEAETLELRIEHHRPRDQRYTVVVALDADGEPGTAPSPGSLEELERTSTAVGGDEVGATSVRVDGTDRPANATAYLLLYTGDAPPEPTPDTAHRTLRLTINATGG